jgi:hypothetical protein
MVGIHSQPWFSPQCLNGAAETVDISRRTCGGPAERSEPSAGLIKVLPMDGSRPPGAATAVAAAATGVLPPLYGAGQPLEWTLQAGRASGGKPGPGR